MAEELMKNVKFFIRSEKRSKICFKRLKRIFYERIIIIFEGVREGRKQFLESSGCALGVPRRGRGGGGGRGGIVLRTA